MMKPPGKVEHCRFHNKFEYNWRMGGSVAIANSVSSWAVENVIFIRSKFKMAATINRVSVAKKMVFPTCQIL